MHSTSLIQTLTVSLSFLLLHYASYEMFITHLILTFLSSMRFTVFFFFLMIRQPPRSTLFPTRRSSDLIGLDHLARVDQGDGAARLLEARGDEMRAQALAPCYQVVAGPRGELPHDDEAGRDLLELREGLVDKAQGLLAALRPGEQRPRRGGVTLAQGGGGAA